MSFPLEPGRLPLPIPGAVEEERGGDKVASLIPKNTHNMPMIRIVYLEGEKYLKN